MSGSGSGSGSIRGGWQSRASVWLCTWFGVGYLPKAPGTWGSLAALGLGVIWLKLGGLPLLAVAAVAVSVLGLWAASIYEREQGREDPQEIVIDEVAGQWLALLPAASLSWAEIGAAFLLFRVADILKPWPASWADKTLPGGVGVMADDLIAGVYAALGLIALQYGGLV